MTPEAKSTFLYDYPGYYELAFSFRDISHEVGCFEQLFDRFAKVPVKRILELACGPSPYLLELCRRGYEYHGLDLNENMLAAGLKKVTQSEWAACFHRESMIAFDLGTAYQFAFVALSSLYARETQEMSTHFKPVARALDPGGLYMLDWCVQFGHSATFSDTGQSWKMEAMAW